MKVIVNGACGRMGSELLKMINGHYRDSELAAAVDLLSQSDDIYKNISEFSGPADVIIDFSYHTATPDLLAYAYKKNIPIVIATTGHTDKEVSMINRTSASLPVFHCANMSVGTALLVELAAKTAAVFSNADIEIIETHHNKKLDAPSGTAIMIANAIRQVRTESFIKCGRTGRGQREPGEIGIHSIRRGDIVGTHEVQISTDTQTITLKHEAHSRALFAEGALAAADFIKDQKPGLYGMKEMLDQIR